MIPEVANEAGEGWFDGSIFVRRIGREAIEREVVGRIIKGYMISAEFKTAPGNHNGSEVTCLSCRKVCPFERKLLYLLPLISRCRPSLLPLEYPFSLSNVLSLFLLSPPFSRSLGLPSLSLCPPPSLSLSLSPFYSLLFSALHTSHLKKNGSSTKEKKDCCSSRKREINLGTFHADVKKCAFT